MESILFFTTNLMEETINKVRFNADVLKPDGKTDLFKDGFGKKLTVIGQPSVGLDDWLDRDRAQIMKLLNRFGVLAVTNVRINSDNVQRWNRVGMESGHTTMPWHSDGYENKKAIVLVQAEDDAVRKQPTLVAPTSIIWERMKMVFFESTDEISDNSDEVRKQLRKIFDVPTNNLVFSFEQIYRSFTNSESALRNAIYRLLKITLRDCDRWIYRHNWQRASALIIDTQHFDRPTGAYSNVVHARILEEQDYIIGTQPWRSFL